MSKSRLVVIGACAVVMALVMGCGRKEAVSTVAPQAPQAAPSAAPAVQGTGTQGAGLAGDASGAGGTAGAALPVLARDLDATAFAAAIEGAQTGASAPILIDVRTPQEFGAGHIEGARNFDMSASGFLDKLADLPKDGQYLLYCRSGNRSSTALETMKAAGYGNVSHLAGGVGAWAASGKKLVN